MIKCKCQQEKAFGKLQYCMGAVSGDHTREGVRQGLKSIQEKRGSGGGGGANNGGVNNSSDLSTFVGTLRPGTPGPGGHPTMHYFNPSFRTTSTPPRKSPFHSSDKEGSGLHGVGVLGLHSSTRVPLETDSNVSSTVTCHKCGDQFNKWEAAEAHHLSKHAGT